MAEAEPVFRARGVTKVYDMGEVKVPALRGVDLDLYPGELVVLLGPSGSGKSTLLNILGGLDTVSGGTVEYRGKDLARATERELTEYRRRHVGFVFQFYNLIPTLSASENVVLGLEVGSRDKGNEGRARHYLEAVGLSDREGFLPQQLSAGQQQRVAIARALAKNPRLVLADEPTGNLDEERAAKVMSTMKSLQEEAGVTFVIVSHNPELRAHADRVLRLHAGKLEA